MTAGVDTVVAVVVGFAQTLLPNRYCYHRFCCYKQYFADLDAVIVDKNELGPGLLVAVGLVAHIVAVVADEAVFAAYVVDIFDGVAAEVVPSTAVPNFAALAPEEANQTRADPLRPVWVAPDNLYRQQHIAAASFHLYDCTLFARS